MQKEGKHPMAPSQALRTHSNYAMSETETSSEVVQLVASYLD